MTYVNHNPISFKGFKIFITFFTVNFLQVFSAYINVN